MDIESYSRHRDSKMKLFTPGPVFVPEFVRKELARHNDTHRNKWYSELQQSVEENLRRLMYTQNDVLIYTSSGTGIMESCMRNLLEEDEYGLVLSCGAFGDRWYEIGVSCGKQVECLRIDNGAAFKKDIIVEALEKKSYSLVTIQFNETSTGVMNNISDIASVVKDHGARFCVDAVSGLAGGKIEVDKNKIDVCLASTQKALALPAGLAVASISEEAFSKAARVKNRGYYFDMILLREMARKKHQTPTTPPIHTLRALDVILDYILNEEGLENRFARHRKMANLVKGWAKKRGLKMLPEEGYESPTVSAIYKGENMDVSWFLGELIQRGYRIVNGYGPLKGKSFRIGHMGELTPDDVKELLEVMDSILEQ